MKGIIYKIEFNDLVYVGATPQKLCQRQSNHNSDLRNRPNVKLYQKCIEQGVDAIKCIWIADVEYNSIAELKMYEETHRKELNATLNTYRCYLTHQDKKEQRFNTNAEYWREHKEQLKITHKKWAENNIERLRNKRKEKYNSQKGYLKERVECGVCGCVVNRSSMPRHRKTIKCIGKND